MPLTSDFYRELLDAMSDGVYFTDAERRISYWNRGAELITGYAAEEVIGKRCMDNILVHVDDEGRQLCLGMCPLSGTIKDGEVRRAEVFLRHKDGHRVPVLVRTARITAENGEVVGGVEVFSDNTSKVSAIEQVRTLESLAYVDQLTELPNRWVTERALESALNEMRRNEWVFGVLLMDVDRFKEVNDTCGHLAGDKALRMVAKVLSGSCRSFDTVGRWGGEEFLAIVKQVDEASLKAAGEKFRVLVEKSAVNLGDRAVRVTLSVGGAVAEVDDTVHTLLKRADERLYSSKEGGRNRVTV